MFKPPTGRSNQEVCTIIVGIQQTARTVERVYVRRGGSMIRTVHTHRLPQGALALDEATSATGLFQAREFPIMLIFDADAYTAQLRRGLAPQ